METKSYTKKIAKLVDAELDKLLPLAKERPRVVHQAMRYSIRGGKRIRPILCAACAQAAGGNIKQALKAASAIEMLHAYSLVHDDLPSMDNDDYRRGRLTCHKKFGVANAILAGDALLTLSFNTLSTATPNPAVNTVIARELSRAAGTFGMIGGQAADIASGEKDLLTLEYININKTGALIAASCKIGAIVAGAKDKAIRPFLQYGEYIGLTFQIIDDMLDNEGFARFMGPKRAYDYAQSLTEKAKTSIACLGPKAKTLNGLADLLVSRKR